MDVIKPPQTIPRLLKRSVFLAGSIEMGAAVDWQAEVEGKLSAVPGTILNPRRDDWDSSWEQSTSCPQFVEQVDWELDALDVCTLILMYFDPNTKSPITLLELGLYANSGKLVVCCPEGFYRKGNVDVTCHRYNVPLVLNLDQLVLSLPRSWAPTNMLR